MDKTLKPFQVDFLLSECRFPAFAGGWGTGKTLLGIIKGLRLSQKYSENLGVILRKEYTDLRVSTMKDFTHYTGLQINEQKKEVKLSNKSEILFLHGAELDIVKNMNIGWALIEQAEELDGPEVFDYLDGRLRRDNAGLRQIMVICNTTDEEHWIYRYWKANDRKDERFKIWEANSFDNADNLPADTIQSWRLLEARNNPVYRRYVMNEWGIGGSQFVVIPPEILKRLTEMSSPVFAGKRRIITCDPSLAGDECVTYAMENTGIIDSLFLNERDTMKIVGHLGVMSGKHKIDDFIIDSIGIGAGICDRLNEQGKRVQRLNSAEKSTNPLYNNRRSEMWWYAREQVQDGKGEYPEDSELRRQLVAPRYKVINSNGEIALEPKDQVKKRIGRSPDRADAWVMGVWGTQFVKLPVLDRMKGYREKRDQGTFMSV